MSWAWGSTLLQLALGAITAGVAAIAARKAHALSRDGAVAATVVGALAVGAGWDWGGMLVAFFVVTSALGRIRDAERSRRTRGVVAKGSARDAMQVAANGGVLAAAAVGQILSPHPAWQALGAGALAAAAADSWATELGTLSSRPPRHILTFRAVPHGTSGGVSLIGSTASVAGAAFMGAMAWTLGWSGATALAAAIAGVAGSLVDSLLGATLQSRRWCDECNARTEQLIHSCGGETRPAGGVSWLDNDWVNMIATATGGAIALVLIAGWGHT